MRAAAAAQGATELQAFLSYLTTFLSGRRLQEQLRAAAVAQRSTESRVVAAEAALELSRKESDTRGSTIRWLEAQVGGAKGN